MSAYRLSFSAEYEREMIRSREFVSGPRGLDLRKYLSVARVFG